MFSDPIADMLTRIRNAYHAHQAELDMPYSNFKKAIAQLLKDNKYLSDYSVGEDNNKKTLHLVLSYPNGNPAITSIRRVSKAGRRLYSGKNKLPYVLSGLGIALISTSKGLMTAQEARKKSLGGEIICEIW